MDERQSLLFSMRYALKRVPIKRARRPDDTEASIMADHLLEHLELCRYEIRKRPPREIASGEGPKLT